VDARREFLEVGVAVTAPSGANAEAGAAAPRSGLTPGGSFYIGLAAVLSVCLRLHTMFFLRGSLLFELLSENKHFLLLGDKGSGSGDLP